MNLDCVDDLENIENSVLRTDLKPPEIGTPLSPVSPAHRSILKPSSIDNLITNTPVSQKIQKPKVSVCIISYAVNLYGSQEHH